MLLLDTYVGLGPDMKAEKSGCAKPVNGNIVISYVRIVFIHFAST